MANINNLNVITFIKDIYQSLKHIDININVMKDNIDSRLKRLEDNQQTIITRLESLEILIGKINEKNYENSILDKNIENELLKKMTFLNNNSIPDEKLDLKPSELTIANLLENNFNLEDINNSLSRNNTKIDNVNNGLICGDGGDNIDNDIKKDTLDDLLFG